MAPDLMTLSLIRHEDSGHLVNETLRRPQLIWRSRSLVDLKSPPPPYFPGCDIANTPSEHTMGNPSDARTRSLVSMYSTGFVFTQNHKHLMKALPKWSCSSNGDQATSSTKTAHNPMPSSQDMHKIATQFVQGRGNGRKLTGEQQVQSLQSEKIRAEHAASMFALLT